jgi:hypothetical protein
MLEEPVQPGDPQRYRGQVRQGLAGGLQTLQKRPGHVQVAAAGLPDCLFPRLPLVLALGRGAFEPLQPRPEFLELPGQVRTLAPARQPALRRQFRRRLGRLADGVVQQVDVGRVFHVGFHHERVTPPFQRLASVGLFFLTPHARRRPPPG